MLRDLCPALANKTYFNYGGQGPLPTPSLEAITCSWKRIQELGPFTNDVWPFVAKEIQSTRSHLAKLCGVAPHRIALTENVTSGCVLPLWGLPFSEGDRLLISDCEHPGIVAACIELARRQHLAIDTLPVKNLRHGANDQATSDSLVLERLEQHLKPSTRLVVLSHLLWNTGQLMPISAVSTALSHHPQQPFLLVDAAQSFAQMPVQEAAAASDIYAFTGHKWACGPEGLGGVALSERVLIEANPTLIGWRSLQNEGHLQNNQAELFHHDSRRFEVATSCVPLMAGLRCSLELLETAGSQQERLSQIRQGSQQLWNQLQQLEGVETLLNSAPAAGLVSFELPQGPPAPDVVQQLGNDQLWIRHLEDPICLRACVHITTEEQELNTLTTALKQLASKGEPSN